MKAAINRESTLHVWVLSTIAVALSAAQALSYLAHIGQRLVVGALLGLPGHEGDVILAQHRATYWLGVCIVCLTGSTVATAPALPLFADASRVARLMARFVLASICSLALTVFILVAAFTIVTALHPMVR